MKIEFLYNSYLGNCFINLYSNSCRLLIFKCGYLFLRFFLDLISNSHLLNS